MLFRPLRRPVNQLPLLRLLAAPHQQQCLLQSLHELHTPPPWPQLHRRHLEVAIARTAAEQMHAEQQFQVALAIAGEKLA
jgi:hypothetical protein